MDVYVDDMVVRLNSNTEHIKDLEEIFRQVRRYGMRLNIAKWTFEVGVGKFLRFTLTTREIKANLDKCAAILEMKSSKNVKEV